MLLQKPLLFLGFSPISIFSPRSSKASLKSYNVARPTMVDFLLAYSVVGLDQYYRCLIFTNRKQHILSGLCLAVGLDLPHTVSFPAPVIPLQALLPPRYHFICPPTPTERQCFFTVPYSVQTALQTSAQLISTDALYTEYTQANSLRKTQKFPSTEFYGLPS